MYVKKCDKVAQENVGTDPLNVLSFLRHDSLDQLSVVVAMRTVLKLIAGMQTT